MCFFSKIAEALECRKWHIGMSLLFPFIGSVLFILSLLCSTKPCKCVCKCTIIKVELIGDMVTFCTAQITATTIHTKPGIYVCVVSPAGRELMWHRALSLVVADLESLWRDRYCVFLGSNISPTTDLWAHVCNLDKKDRKTHTQNRQKSSSCHSVLTWEAIKLDVLQTHPVVCYDFQTAVYCCLPVSQKQYRCVSVCVFVDVWIMPAHREAFSFWWDLQVFTHLPYWFSLALLFTLPGDWMSQLVPPGRTESVSDKETEDEGKRKVRGEKWRREHKQGEEEPGGACGRHDRWGPRWPLTLIMTSEVAPEVRGCVKVPLRRFTPLLGDDDLMQPPQPVWHDQCCTLPAAPKGHTSISNPATQGPLKAPYRQSQWAGGKGT